MGGVFINYRGADSRSYGALLYAELSRYFGAETVFLDSESIPAGSDFAAQLLSRVRQSNVVLAVIGDRWLTADDGAGCRSIDRTDDWVQRELAEAFAAEVDVIPVLTDEASLPAASQLPAAIAELSGRQYHRLRHRDASTDLSRLITDLTAGYPHLAEAARRHRPVPRQLPASPPGFIDRPSPLSQLTAALRTPSQHNRPNAPARQRPAAPMVVISGTGGSGKTWLALRWAHEYADMYPDGQLYVNLRGFSPEAGPLPPAAALHGFLIALGVDPAGIPPDEEAQAALYRSVLADRQVLVVLDNAAHSAQVMPLIPTGQGCAALVTSRRRLTGLTITDGAESVLLDMLTPDQALRLLRQRLGAARVAAEPTAAAAIRDAAAGLPLALAIIAARAAAHPAFPLRLLAAELRDQTSRLDALDASEPDLSLRATLSWSHRALSGDAAELFGLLAAAPGPDIGIPAAARLAGTPRRRVGALLRELEAVSLVQHRAPGRYQMHDLVRLYASEHCTEMPMEAVSAALRRIVDFYLRTTFAADRLLAPKTAAIDLAGLTEGGQPEPIHTEAEAWTWIDTEHSCLIAAARTATEHGWTHATWQLAWTLDTYHYRRGNLLDDLAIWQNAQAAIDRSSDVELQNLVHRHLGEALVLAGQPTQATQHLQHALELALQTGDPYGQAHTHRALWRAWSRQAEHRRALEHATQAASLYRNLGNPVWLAEALNQVGSSHARLAHHELAASHCAEALDLCRRHDHQEGAARTLATLGYTAHQTGRHDTAIQHYQEAIAYYRLLGNTYEEAEALDHLGCAYAAHGDARQATANWHAALIRYKAQHRTVEADRLRVRFAELGVDPTASQ